MRQFTLKRLFVGIAMLCVVIALAAPALRGSRSDSSKILFICSVLVLCTALGGFIGAAVRRRFNCTFVGATVFAIAGFLFGVVKGSPVALAWLGWPQTNGMGPNPSKFDVWLLALLGIAIPLLPAVAIIAFAIYFSRKK